jgi:hypothetical protein
VKLEAIRFGRHTYTTTVPYGRTDAKIFDDIYQTLTTPSTSGIGLHTWELHR